ncbi:YbhB/YbcL family Raf kinase inhibitor-like protein [uncultured Methylibium sp.]|uniref:YbhB/YbcL family Raf kinase inhibitor-like protein n=1 Tax=uncultured Methylibium sp. TaxID=381093 RepID=UPI0025DD1EF5|nr:YbhB/YbcL family Raf kinase inhibitor-like protein [uncultured Methylibium sp.]
MKLTSTSWTDGGRIPARHAAGKPDAATTVTFSDNVSPQLAWSGAPPGTKSFALICHDPDVPSRGDDVNQPGREVPADLPRVDFFHWVLVDLPPTLSGLAEGEFSRGFTPRGKPGPASLHGARQGLNDYTGWFAANADMSGSYHGYDGPFPPFNDALLHRYVFTLFALDLARLSVEGSFTGAQAREAMRGHVLAEASFGGTYTLNARLAG